LYILFFDIIKKQNLKQSFKKTESTLWKSYSDFKLRDDELNDELRKARKVIYFDIFSIINIYFILN